MTGIQWVNGQTPERLATNIERYGERVWVGLNAIAEQWSLDVLKAMRAPKDKGGAPWTDRTPAARPGLFRQIRREAWKYIEIYLAHTMEYGVYLELSNAGKYAVIMPKIEQYLPMLEKMLKDLFRD